MSDKDDLTQKLFACFGALMMIPVVIVGSLLLNGWVFQQLWAWFAVPQFGVAPLSLAMAIGLTTLVAATRGHYREFEKEGETDGEKWARIGSVLVFRPAILLLFGYVAHRFVA